MGDQRRTRHPGARAAFRRLCLQTLMIDLAVAGYFVWSAQRDRPSDSGALIGCDWIALAVLGLPLHVIALSALGAMSDRDLRWLHIAWWCCGTAILLLIGLPIVRIELLGMPW